jgi:hypothetical protein
VPSVASLNRRLSLLSHLDGSSVCAPPHTHTDHLRTPLSTGTEAHLFSSGTEPSHNSRLFLIAACSWIAVVDPGNLGHAPDYAARKDKVRCTVSLTLKSTRPGIEWW